MIASTALSDILILDVCFVSIVLKSNGEINKMSKEKPEILDLWMDENDRMYLVIKSTHKYVHLITKTLVGKRLTFKQYVRRHIVDNWTFIGKSTTTIHNLFEVQK